MKPTIIFQEFEQLAETLNIKIIVIIKLNPMGQ